MESFLCKVSSNAPVHKKYKKMSEDFYIQEEYSLRHLLSWLGDNGYFGWKHGVNVTVSSQIGLQQDTWMTERYGDMLCFSHGHCISPLGGILSICGLEDVPRAQIYDAVSNK